MAERVERKPQLIKAVLFYGRAAAVPLGMSLLVASTIDVGVTNSRINSQVNKENPPIAGLASATSEITLFDKKEHDSLLATGKM